MALISKFRGGHPIGIVGGLTIMWNGEVIVKVESSFGELINMTCRD